MRRVASFALGRYAAMGSAAVAVARAHQHGQQGRPRGGPSGSQQVPQEFRAPPGSTPAPARGNQPPAPSPAADEEVPPPVKPTDSKFISCEAAAATGIATLRLNRAPVNSLSLEVFTELNQWLLWLGSDEATKAVVLASAIPLVYSAGLDINEFSQPQQERLAKFWTSFQENWLILNSFPKPLVAAISGNAPAGGCILALGCDYRIMARHPKGAPEKPYRIGLNETKLGIVAPPWVMAGYSYVIGTRKAERMLQLGETPTADEALAIGLVDAVVDEDQVLAAAQKEAQKFASIPNQARWMSRDMMRQEVTQFLRTEEERDYDTQFFLQMLSNEEVQKHIAGYLARLSGNKANKK